jgi:hypothetical protein
MSFKGYIRPNKLTIPSLHVNIPDDDFIPEGLEYDLESGYYARNSKREYYCYKSIKTEGYDDNYKVQLAYIIENQKEFQKVHETFNNGEWRFHWITKDILNVVNTGDVMTFKVIGDDPYNLHREVILTMSSIIIFSYKVYSEILRVFGIEFIGAKVGNVVYTRFGYVKGSEYIEDNNSIQLALIRINTFY